MIDIGVVNDRSKASDTITFLKASNGISDFNNIPTGVATKNIWILVHKKVVVLNFPINRISSDGFVPHKKLVGTRLWNRALLRDHPSFGNLEDCGQVSAFEIFICR
jgi:hypothetical protein